MSDSETVQPTGQTFRIGNVFSLGFSILGKHLVTFVSLSALFYLPMLLLTFMGLNRMGQGDVEGGVAMTFLGSILSMVFGLILIAAVTYGTFRSLQGREVSFGDSLQNGLGRFLPVLGVSIVVGIAVAFGTLLLIVPGLIIATLLYVSVPAVVVERKGVFESLSRSAELTKGHRWQIFGVIVLLFLLNFALGALTELIAPTRDFSNFAANAAPSISPLNIILTAVVGIISYALGAIFPAVIYYKLRVVKEGLDVDQIAQIFD